ncbi:hypothetical protein MK489_22345 [Myxococcota bacterium]|nr:hypothetical protein [Myxococcota bacterium]
MATLGANAILPTMNSTTRTVTSVTIGALVAAGLATSHLDGPWGMIPGGRFHGEGRACTHESLTAFGDSREIEIEVRPQRPRSMTTWSVRVDGALFIPADFLTPWKRWPYQVIDAPNVRLRSNGTILECRAKRVSDAPRIEKLRRAIARKYDLQPDSRAGRVEVWWFKIVPRTEEG